MQKSFNSSADLTHQLRELAGHGLISALKSAGDPALAPETRIHGVRTEIKKLRALLRLIRADFPDYQAENKAARDAAHGLSATRDAAVIKQTLAALDPEKVQNVPHLAQLVEALNEQAPSAIDEDQQLHEFSQVALGMRDRILHWTVTGEHRDVLARGAAALYRSARKRPDTSDGPADATALHEWRKHVKYLMNARGLLGEFGASLPEKKALKGLSDLLGKHHDLQVLNQFIAARLDADTFEPLFRRIAKEQMRLQRQAGKVADKLFGPKPRVVERAVGRAVGKAGLEAGPAVH